MAVVGLWTFALATPGIDLTSVDLTGFEVEARDGGIGKVDEATHEAGGSYIVVDSGPWIFGKKVMLPAGVVRDVDVDTETVYIDSTQDEITSAPEFDPDRYRDESYRNEIGGYYARREGERV